MELYQHVEKLGTDEVDGILDGTVYLFTKLDGTNCGVSFEDDRIKVCSRRREISISKDNAGSCEYVLSNRKFGLFFEEYPTLTLYGEFLVKHTIKTYKDAAWHKLYVFDVFDKAANRYLTYEEYVPMLETYGIEYIPLIAKLDHPTEDEVVSYLDKTTFLQVSEGFPGEGLVIHAPGFVNKYGRTVWAKVVRDEYKARKQHHAKVISPEDIESKIVNELLTDALIEKEVAKIYNELGDFNNKQVGMYLGTIYHTFVTECAWEIVKRYKNPKIDFKVLNSLCNDKTKAIMTLFFKELNVRMPWS